MSPDGVMVAGLRVGHATDAEARTGCTVFLGPFTAAVCVAGMATGSRELGTLSPLHLAPLASALLLSGGSAFGLAAADGVMAWLEARGEGFSTGAGRVPIVPAAVIFDLGVGRADVRPDAAMGRAACDAARAAPPAEGRVGAGTGATVGKLLGAAGADAGGFGHVTLRCGDALVSAFAVVNALGDVLDAEGRIVAGARRPDGTFAGSAALLHGGRGGGGEPVGPGMNTTLAVVATDAPLDRSALDAVARMAVTALGRRIEPVNTPFDGDIVFALSTGTAPPAGGAPPVRLLEIGVCAAAALGSAIERAVVAGRAG
jgi:L-aminopeptidase/D-esterase-like protein